MRVRTCKKMFGQRRSRAGRLARALTFSLYPKHLDLLRQRERELGVSRSILLQLFCEIELKHGLLRRELLSRLTTTQTGTSIPKP